MTPFGFCNTAESVKVMGFWVFKHMLLTKPQILLNIWYPVYDKWYKIPLTRSPVDSPMIFVIYQLSAATFMQSNCANEE